MRIAIIGGGVYGTAIAYFIQELDGSHDVQLFEKDTIAAASTGKSAGIVRHHYSHDIQIRFAKRGREILEQFPERVGQEAGFYQNGYLIMAGEENEEQFRHNVSLQQNIGLDVDLLEPSELSEYVPGIDSDGVAVAAIEHEAGFADPYLVATGFANAARELGVQIHTKTPVTDIETANDGVTAVRTEEERYPVDLVVNAAGPWAAEVAEMVDISIPMSRYEAKVVTLSASEDYTPEYPTASDIDLGLYAKPETGGDFISGGMERNGGHESIAGQAELEGVTNANLETLSELFEERLPSYADASVVNSWSELITAPPDWHQIIGTPPGLNNFYIAAGGSGHGFKEAPGFAEAIAESIVGEEPSNDLSRYHPNRFDSGDVFVGGYGDGSRS